MTFERKTQDKASQSIVVEGNRKVGAGTIRSYFQPGPGGRLDAIEIDAGREALYATGLFQEVRTSQTGGTLTVTVIENVGADAEIMPQRSEAPPPKRRKRASSARSTKPSARGYLDGQMLIAMPSMRDERFSRTLIYICAHSSDGAMGIVVNQPAANISFPDLLVQLEVIPAADLIQLPSRAGVVKVLKGGPVETGRGFVLHSADFFIENSTLPIDDGVCLTATLDILKAIARGSGPASALLALGYAGWAPGQLEAEIQENGWLHCSADPELIFGTDTDGKYEKALRKLGVGPGMLSSEAGHA